MVDRSMRYPSLNALQTSGLLRIDETFFACLVCDMTPKGATLRFKLPMPLPAIFSLQLARDGTAEQRTCSIIWQDTHEASVLFV
jgi:hypothetical protein